MRIRAIAIPAVLATLLMLTAVACSDDDNPTIEATPPGTPSATSSASSSPSPTPDNAKKLSVTFAGGQASGDTEVTVARGTRIELEVTSDVADEVHNHLTDEAVDIAAGETVTIKFLASAPGIFDIELEDLGETLVELRITG